MKQWKPLYLKTLFWVCILYSHNALALNTYDELRMLDDTDLATNPTQVVTHPTIGGTFQYSATNPYLYNGDNGTIIRASGVGLGLGYWVRQYTYDENNPIELDWFEPDGETDLTTIIEDLLLETNGDLYLKAPSSAMTISASPASFSTINTFHLIENNVLLTIALKERRLFSKDGSIDANDPNDLDRLIWIQDDNVTDRWSADLSAIAINEPIQNLWAEEPDGKVMHWGRPATTVDQVTTVTGSNEIVAGHMRWFSTATALTVTSPVTPASQFPQLEISPDSYVQMWNFIGPEEIMLGGPQRNITFTGAFRTELSSLGAWNYVQNYTRLGGHGDGAPPSDSDANNLALIGFRPQGSSTTDRAEVRANFDNCFHSCTNVQGSPGSVFGNSDDAFEEFIFDSNVNTNGARFNSGLVHLHMEDAWISDPWVTGGGWSGDPFVGVVVGENFGNWDQRLNLNRAAGVTITGANIVTGTVTLQYGVSRFFGFGPRNGNFTHGVDLNWQGSTPGILQASLADPVTELWTLENSFGPMAATLENAGDWLWSNGQLQVYDDGTLITDSLTAVHQRYTIRYKDIGWSQSGTRSDYNHNSFKIDHTGPGKPNESFIQFELLPGDYGTFGIQGGMVNLQATNEHNSPVWNLSDLTWAVVPGFPMSWALNYPDPVVQTLTLMGNGKVLPAVSSFNDLLAPGVEDGTWYGTGTSIIMQSQQDPATLFDLLIGGQNVYKNEYHNIALDGFDAEHLLRFKHNPTADVFSADFEPENGQDYSQPHTFVGPIDQSIAMYSGDIRLHEHSKVNNLIGYNIRIFNSPHTIDTANGDVGSAFTRYGRGNKVTDVTLNGQLILEAGTRDNTAGNLRFIGLPRQVIRIVNPISDPETDQDTEISLNNIQAPAGSTIVNDSIGNVDVTLDGVSISLPYYFGATQQSPGNIGSPNANTVALYHLDGSLTNAIVNGSITDIEDNTSYIAVTDPNLPGFQMASENGGFRIQTVSMDAFNNGINVSLWAALSPDQLGKFAELIYFKGTNEDEFAVRILTEQRSAIYEPGPLNKSEKDLLILLKTIDGNQSIKVTGFSEITNALDGNMHHYQIAYNPSGDRRIRIAFDDVLRWVSEPVPGTAVWQNVNVSTPVRGQVGIFCLWGSCVSTQTQGIIDEVHIQQCPVGDTVCSELSNVTTIESIQDLDGDNILDNWETLYALDPSNPSDALQDADGDTLSNRTEFTIGTNPLTIDTDGDGFSDDLEITAGSDPLNIDSTPSVSAPTIGMAGLLLLLFGLFGAGLYRIRYCDCQTRE